MNFAGIVLILLLVCAGIFGLIFVATSSNNTANVDSYDRVDSKQTNMTRGNMTALMPVGINIMGYIAIIVAFLVVVIAVVGLMAYSGRTHRSSRW